ncbi:MAG: hypothetical protein COB20_08255 [SAR86 cluster bacterium]|uniref:TonB-dependent receptor n=1 Tax=SAR86 cluster bacterium TaxID=2030880 RepID=A0A2A4X3S1_9GAMM|nr:MAG: hypothetical protein COB20_08255 [SAR86 cluster bacterium]
MERNMQRRIPHKRSLLCAAISLSLLPLASQSIAQQDTVEEVVVTGSYIRRSEGFTGASSVIQLDAEELEAQGTLNIGEVIKNLAFVNGASSAISNTIQGTSSRTSTIDLRGLGDTSTLTLLDGKRLVNQNVNALIPTIALQRMDIVADGAAALYGSEAVAGVVNFVPYKSYDGFKMDTYAEQDERGDYDEHSLQMMWGGQIGVLDVVVAAQHRENTRLGWDERSDIANAGLTVSSNAPGNWFTPDRGPDGQYLGTSTRTPDPNCAPGSERTAYTKDQVANPFGNLLGTSCFFDFGDNRSYREPQQVNQYYGNATWEIDDDLTLSLQGFRTYQRTNTFTSTSNPGNSRIGELPAVRGEIPGNPFFATNSLGEQLYGFDANGDGVPDRGTEDLNNDGTFDYLIAGTTPNGVLLHEDVAPRTLRPINKTHTRSSGHTEDRDNKSNATDIVSRWTAQADFTVPFLDGWEGMASYTHNVRDFTFMSNQNYSISAMIQGLNCDTVNDRDACYNPFFVVDQADNNTVAVMDSIAARFKENVTDTLDVIDIVLNGEVPLFGFELPGGPVAAAVGYQFRDDKYTNIPSATEIAGDTWIGGTERERPTSGSREVDAYFIELSIPVLSNVEVELAVRREEFNTGQEATTPKFGVTWAATDWLTLRATQGDAFIAPALEDLFDPVTCTLNTVTDKFSPFSAFTTACGGGNPTLTNEESESQQIGFDIALGDFDLSVTWNNTEFENRIIDVRGQDIMDLDFLNFQTATGFAGDGFVSSGGQPTLDQLQAWINNPASNKDIIRDPGDISTILQVNNTSTINAETVEVEAIDIAANYSYSNDWGNFRASLQATFIDHFYYQSDASQPIVDGAGLYNDVTGAAPELPEWKANLTLGWSRGNHSVNTISRFTDAMPYDGPQFTHLDFFGGFVRPQNMTEVHSRTLVDASYTYRGLELFGGEGAVTIGSRNIFDKDAQPSPEFAGLIGGLQTAMGRNIYARFVYDF